VSVGFAGETAEQIMSLRRTALYSLAAIAVNEKPQPLAK